MSNPTYDAVVVDFRILDQNNETIGVVQKLDGGYLKGWIRDNEDNKLISDKVAIFTKKVKALPTTELIIQQEMILPSGKTYYKCNYKVKLISEVEGREVSNDVIAYDGPIVFECSGVDELYRMETPPALEEFISKRKV